MRTPHLRAGDCRTGRAGRVAIVVVVRAEKKPGRRALAGLTESAVFAVVEALVFVVVPALQPHSHDSEGGKADKKNNDHQDPPPVGRDPVVRAPVSRDSRRQVRGKTDQLGGAGYAFTVVDVAAAAAVVVVWVPDPGFPPELQ